MAGLSGSDYIIDKIGEILLLSQEQKKKAKRGYLLAIFFLIGQHPAKRSYLPCKACSSHFQVELPASHSSVLRFDLESAHPDCC